MILRLEESVLKRERQKNERCGATNNFNNDLISLLRLFLHVSNTTFSFYT